MGISLAGGAAAAILEANIRNPVCQLKGRGLYTDGKAALSQQMLALLNWALPAGYSHRTLRLRHLSDWSRRGGLLGVLGAETRRESSNCRRAGATPWSPFPGPPWR